MIRRFWLALHPDIQKPIGGVKQMHRLAESLCRHNLHATIIQDKSDFHPHWFKSDVNTISFKLLQSRGLNAALDVLILPETYLTAFNTYFPGIPKVIFNQNGSYTFGKPPVSAQTVQNLYSQRDVVHVLTVSKYDHHLLSMFLANTSTSVSLLVNPIEANLFHPGSNKTKTLSFMPRKNAKDSDIVTFLLRQQSFFKGWNLAPIQNLSQEGVSSVFRKSIAFLSFGHPEGFGLPLAEAAACGCALIGYSGLGGREILQEAQSLSLGWDVEYGDWTGFVSSTRSLIYSLNESPSSLLQSALQLSKLIRSRYSIDEFDRSVYCAFNHINKTIDSLTT